MQKQTTITAKINLNKYPVIDNMSKGNCLLDTLSIWEVSGRDKTSPTKDTASSLS